MQKLKNIVFTLGGIALLAASFIGVTLAAFTDSGKVLGSAFSTGSADLKFSSDLSGENLTDEVPGPTFTNIGPLWQGDYLVKLVNNGTGKIQVASNAYYETANDPDSLRSDIEASIIEWNDYNDDGILQDGEEGNLIEKKTIIKWKTEGIGLGDIEPGFVKPLIIRFNTNDLSGTKQGKNALFDFVFDSIQVN